MLVNYAMLLPLHFLRSMETASGDKNVYSSTEKAFLASQRKVFNDAVINFLTVRRSMMFVSVVFCVLAFFLEAAEVPNAIMTRKAWVHKSRHLDRIGYCLTLSDLAACFWTVWRMSQNE